MNIGIIGTGNLGRALGGLFARAGNAVRFGSREPDRASTIVEAISFGATLGTIAEAADFAEVIVLAIPWTAVPNVLTAAGPLADKIVLDCTNPLTPDFMGLTIGHTTSAGEEVARLVPGARVVKAFNTVLAPVIQAGPEFGAQRATVFYCGDDGAAKEIASQLITDIGFEPVDAGPLQNARYLEPLTELIIQLAYGRAIGTGIAIKLLRR